ncbi:MAG: NUDIX domain-containing protein [Nakamurella sp.]
MTDAAQRFPLLHAPERWDWAAIDVQFSTDLPPDEIVQSVHAVGFVGDRVVVCRDERPDVWFLPGGTREPDESLDDCLSRELREEAGARLAGPFTPIGAHVGLSEQQTPYRPHLPHPRIGWLWGYAEVVVDGEPTSPAGGEQILEVRIVDISEARRLLVNDNVWGAELLDLAIAMRGGVDS